MFSADLSSSSTSPGSWNWTLSDSNSLLPVRDFLWRLTSTECLEVEALSSLLLIGLLVKNLLEAQACFISNKLILVAPSDFRRQFLKQSMEFVIKISLKICLKQWLIIITGGDWRGEYGDLVNANDGDVRVSEEMARLVKYWLRLQGPLCRTLS